MTQQDVAAFVSDLRAAMEELQVEPPDLAASLCPSCSKRRTSFDTNQSPTPNTCCSS